MKRFKLTSALLAAALLVTTVPVTTQAEVTYEEQDSGTNMGQSFTGSATVTFGQTPSFTVKIPKTITLDTDGAGKYTVGVKGQIPSKYTINVVPDETITMEEENGLLDDITADVTAGKTKWTAAELNSDLYVENEENTIQMQSIDYGKFEGTLNFNVSAELLKVELKDASDEVKKANNFIGTGTLSLQSAYGCIDRPAGVNSFKVGDIVYTNGGTVKNANNTMSAYVDPGYYKVTTASNYNLLVVLASGMESTPFTAQAEYLGESYKV